MQRRNCCSKKTGEGNSPRESKRLSRNAAIAVYATHFIFLALLFENIPEAIAVLVTQVMELARDGHSVSTIMDLGMQMLGRRQVIPGIAEILEEVQVQL